MSTAVKSPVRAQDVAEQKLNQIRKRIDKARQRHIAETRKAASTARLIQSLERSATHYAKRASMTDAEIEAERQRWLERRAQRPKRRGMNL
jgi:flagellar biosynthesis chaperone FliJ